MSTSAFRTNRIQVPWNERKEKLKIQRNEDEANKESEFKSLSQSDIKEKTFNFKKNTQSGSLKIDEIIPESFALVREAAKRTLNERHYDVQLAGGLILHNA